MISLDQFLEEGSQSILRLFSIQALCTTCQVSLNVENGDFSQMLFHVRVFHRLMLSPKKDEDFYCEDSNNSNPPSPSVSISKIHQANCDVIKNDTQVKEESAHTSLVSIKILKKEGGLGKQKKKWDIWKHWIKDKDDLCTCKHCGETRAGGTEDIKMLRNHTTLVHLNQLDHDAQEKIKNKRTRKSKVWEHFTATDEKRTEFQCNLCSSLVTADKKKVRDKERKFYKHLSKFHKPVYEEYRHNREFVCSYCGKNFISRDGLKYHIAHHTDIKEKHFKCTTCNKEFSTKGLLKRHELIHSGDRAFVCQECGKRFSQRSHLTNHTKLHTGETPFNCDKCGKNFRMKHHLTRHQCKI